jgi:hypothetical protein
MANRYLVNASPGPAVWGESVYWSTSSGGAGGASVPTDFDDVFFDANSASANFILDVNSSARCKSFNALSVNDKMTLRLNSFALLRVSGEWFNPSSALFALSVPNNNLHFVGSTAYLSPIVYKRIVTNGVVIPSLVIGAKRGTYPDYYPETITNYWRLDSDLNVGTLNFGLSGELYTVGTTLGTFPYDRIPIYAYNINAVTIRLSNYPYEASSFKVNAWDAWHTNAYLPPPPSSGTSTINVSGSITVPFLTSDYPALAQINAVRINMTSPNAKLIPGEDPAVLYFNQLTFTSTVAGQREISGNWSFAPNTYYEWTYDSPTDTWTFTPFTTTQITTFSTASARGCVLYFNANMGATGFPVFNLSGTSQFRYLITSQSSILSLSNTTASFKPVSPSISYADFFAINCTNPASLVGTSLGNIGNNTNITFQTARDVYWNQVAGGNWIDNAWALSAGGAVSYDNQPLPQDTVYIVNTGLNSSATIVFNSSVTSSVIPSINGLSRTLSATLSVPDSLLRFIGSSYALSSSITLSLARLSPVLSAVTIDIAGTVTTLLLSSSWTTFSGAPSFILNRNLTVTTGLNFDCGTLFFNTYTIFCQSLFLFGSNSTYLCGLNFTGGGLLKASVRADFYNNSASAISDITGTSNIEVGSAFVSTVLTLPDSPTSSLSAYGRKLNVKVISSGVGSSVQIDGITSYSTGTNVQTNFAQVKNLDLSSTSSIITLGNSGATVFSTIAIYGDLVLGVFTQFFSTLTSTTYKARRYWIMSADANSAPVTTITTNGNTQFFGDSGVLVFNAGDQNLTHEFSLLDNLSLAQNGLTRTKVSSAVALVSGKLNLNGRTLTATNFIIGPLYYARWLNSAPVASWGDIYQKQIVFNGGRIDVTGVRFAATQTGGTPSTWNTFGWELVSSPSLVSMDNGTGTGTIRLKPYGDGYGYDTEFRGGCTTSNSTASTPSATPISYPCIVENMPVSATNGFGSVIISGNTIFNNTLRTQTPSLYPSFVFNPTSVTTINGDFTMVGGSTTKGKLTSTTTTPANITKSGTAVDPTNIKVSYTNVNPLGLWIGREVLGVEDLGNNTGWYFTTLITNNNISESVSLSTTSSVLVVVTMEESIQVSSSSIQLQYGEIAENMIIYQYFEPTVRPLWGNIDTDSPSLPDWDSNNSV